MRYFLPVAAALVLSGLGTTNTRAEINPAPEMHSPESHALESQDGGRALLQEARRNFYGGSSTRAVKLFKQYLSTTRADLPHLARRFYVLDAVGRIYLQLEEDPDGAIAYFSGIADDSSLSAAEQDIAHGWVGAAREWKKFGRFASSLKAGSQLFEAGKRYYEQASKRLKFPMDPAGNAEFSIAATYLIPFIAQHHRSEQGGQALYMMGDIRRRAWFDNEYWSENQYLIEAITSYPHTALALRSWTILNDDVHFGYSGTAGDDTPASWLVLLKDLKITAAVVKARSSDFLVRSPTPH